MVTTTQLVAVLTAIAVWFFAILTIALTDEIRHRKKLTRGHEGTDRANDSTPDVPRLTPPTSG